MVSRLKKINFTYNYFLTWTAFLNIYYFFDYIADLFRISRTMTYIFNEFDCCLNYWIEKSQCIPVIEPHLLPKGILYNNYGYILQGIKDSVRKNQPMDLLSLSLLQSVNDDSLNEFVVQVFGENHEKYKRFIMEKIVEFEYYVICYIKQVKQDSYDIQFLENGNFLEVTVLQFPLTHFFIISTLLCKTSIFIEILKKLVQSTTSCIDNRMVFYQCDICRNNDCYRYNINFSLKNVLVKRLIYCQLEYKTPWYIMFQ